MIAAKRALDVVVAGVGLLVAAPVLAIVALLVKAGDGGPIFFRQVRVGRHGVPFRIWKFRTMVPEAAEGRQVTAAGDLRVTPIGARLRRLKLDELPQLLNVLTGDMSLVGPRPEVPHFVARYTPEQRKLLDFLPGLTDPATLRFRREEQLLAGAADPDRVYAERIMPEKGRISLEYARRATLRSDLGVVARTLRLLLHDDAAPGAGRLGGPFPGAS